jgi:hypothetical protein
MFVMVTWCLVAAGTETATAQALCSEAADRGFEVQFPAAPHTMTVEADLAAFGGTLPGGTWRAPVPGGIASDGLALDAVSFTRNAKPKFGSSSHTFDVAVDLRASDSMLVELELVVIDGDRTLRLGVFTDIAVRCEAKRVSQTFSISDHDFVSFFAGGRAPKLRIKRTTFVGGC